MKTELHRYVKAVSPERLPALLKTPDLLQSLPMGVVADLQEIVRVFAGLGADLTGRERAVLDRELVEPLHRALRGLSRRDAADMRFWHWFCINVAPRFVWTRWHGSVPVAEEVESLLATQRAMPGRFLGSATLNGVSRNALARLWWCAETLSNGGADYDLVREALTYQDFFQAIFERKLGLYPPTARVLLRLYRHGGLEKERREALKLLNHSFTTIVAEALDEEDIERLLKEPAL